MAKNIFFQNSLDIICVLCYGINNTGELKVVRASTKVDMLKSSIASQVIDGKFKPGDKLPSIRDLARDFGVSHVTASLAVSELSASGLIDVRPGVGAFVAEKNDFGEMPKQLTIGIALLNSNTTSFVDYSGLNHPAVGYMLAGFHTYFPNEKASVKLLGYRKGQLADKNSAVSAAVRSGRVDGLIVTGPITPDEIDFVQSNNVAIVLCNHLVPERSVPRVFINWQSGFRNLLTKLINLGHNRIELITYKEEWLVKQERGKGYVETANSLGLKEFSHDSIHIIDNSDRPVSREYYDAVVASAMSNRPTALIAFDEVIANRVVRYCYDNGVQIPGEFSLVALNDMTPDSHPLRLTALNIQSAFVDMIYEACSLLERTIKGQTVSSERVMISTSIVEGESVGKREVC